MRLNRLMVLFLGTISFSYPFLFPFFDCTHTRRGLEMDDIVRYGRPPLSIIID